MRRLFPLVHAGLLVALFTPQAEATAITYNYTGTVTSGSGMFSIFPGGTALTGTFTFDDQLVDSTVGPAGDVFNAGTLANQAFSSVWNLTLQIGAISLTSASNANVVGTNHHLLELLDTTPNDRFSFRVVKPAGVNSDDEARLLLTDAVPVAAPDGIQVGNNGLTGTMAGAIAILNSLDPALFSNTSGSLWTVYDASGVALGTLNFRLTSVSPAAVPEPTSMLLLGTGLAGLAARRYRQRKPRQ